MVNSLAGGLARFLLVTTMLFLMWWVLTSSLDPQEVYVGLGVSALIALFTLQSPSLGARRLLSPKRVIMAFIYLGVLLKAIVESNIDVARRVIAPTININPGVVRVKTRLESKVARLILANSITLTPGTLTVDIEGDTLLIHWIDIQSEDIDGATRAIVSQFEGYLEVIFG
ncbi:Na+/H+ antiporter subunit E [Myxococcota bacterium]|nr:Na+/H+ antiporter subunit E [Myxococcota bacterium]MBU1431804.1 Na+/H+ antiporter subunit E [Myxococcota bacterium]MBU1896658.1 Na+/H+ antiporter subunit E [Myxococcota bacterium]